MVTTNALALLRFDWVWGVSKASMGIRKLLGRVVMPWRTGSGPAKALTRALEGWAAVAPWSRTAPAELSNPDGFVRSSLTPDSGQGQVVAYVSKDTPDQVVFQAGSGPDATYLGPVSISSAPPTPAHVKWSFQCVKDRGGWEEQRPAVLAQPDLFWIYRVREAKEPGNRPGVVAYVSKANPDQVIFESQANRVLSTMYLGPRSLSRTT